MKQYKAIGLMSGTSVDGVDAALIRTDGELMLEQLGWTSVPYPDAVRQKVRALFNRAPDPAVEKELTLLNAEAVTKLLKETNHLPQDIDIVGFHGQTISHAPERGHTCQMGDGALLAKTVRIDVINDFRSADVKAGGQGAPLVPIYHRAIAATLDKPVVFLNIGGVANVTYVGTKGDIFAFDTGPGNALLDDWMLHHTGKPYDENGRSAATGTVDEKILAQLLSHPYFSRKPPKSLDRNAFVSDTWKHLSPPDGAATLSAFTVASIVQSVRFMPEKPQCWIVCGGGRMNGTFMKTLAETLNTPVAPIETIGLNGNATEAEAFAYLAVRSMTGLHLTFPTTTGVRHPMQGGILHPYIEMPDETQI
jgi:anhydro-N-acetylmuramic acid kinase